MKHWEISQRDAVMAFHKRSQETLTDVDICQLLKIDGYEARRIMAKIDREWYRTGRVPRLAFEQWLTKTKRRGIPTAPIIGVYFIAAPQVQLMKIGMTGDLAERATTLRDMNAARLELIGFINDVGRTVEREWHAKHAAHRERGEWFRPHHELLADMEERADWTALRGWRAQ